VAFATPVDRAPREPDGPPETWLPLLEDRSPNAWVCPFLRAVDDDDALGVPVESPDPANRCAAMREAVPQSLRQQELVCLTSGHINCPRYLRGAVVVSDLPPPVVRAGRSWSPAVLASVLVLVASFTASVAFVLARGGIDLQAAVVVQPSATASATATAVAAASPVAVVPVVPVAASVEPVPSVSPSPVPSPTPSPTPTSTPTAEPTPTATPKATPKPTPKPTTAPTSTRYRLLDPCPSKPDCWIYTVRSGDNLYSIANYFGIPLETVRRLNPWTETRRLKAGLELILPPPRR